jgi:hypothetical protein
MPLASLLGCLSLAGCHARSAATANATAEQRAELHAEVEDQREQLERIPAPMKSRYMAIRSFESWENPYLTVQGGMVELHVTRGDSNPTDVGVGGMFRPEAARRVELNIANDKLGEAMSSIPGDAWPYGRVVAVEEAHHTPPAAEPAIRRNLEATLARLSDLGIQVYDPAEGKLQ